MLLVLVLTTRSMTELTSNRIQPGGKPAKSGLFLIIFKDKALQYVLLYIQEAIQALDLVPMRLKNQLARSKLTRMAKFNLVFLKPKEDIPRIRELPLLVLDHITPRNSLKPIPNSPLVTKARVSIPI